MICHFALMRLLLGTHRVASLGQVPHGCHGGRVPDKLVLARVLRESRFQACQSRHTLQLQAAQPGTHSPASNVKDARADGSVPLSWGLSDM